jgi:hypothetical protein
MKVRTGDLGQLSFLAEGGFGRVSRVDGYTLPGDATPLAYKEFTVGRAEQARSAQDAVTFRAGLAPVERTELDRYTAWPRGLVDDATGSVCGLLMPLIPPEFFCRMADPASGTMTSKPREMSWLIASQKQRTAAQIDLPGVDHTERLILLAQLVYIIGRLHKYGWVFGDLSFGNVVFALNPLRVMLIDCDGAAARANHSRAQFSTPFWDPPECPCEPPRQQDLQDDVTDTYKLGLAILRCLTPGQGASSTRAVGRFAGELDAAGVRLVARALSGDRATRPTAKDLYVYLSQTVSPKVKPPEVVFARLASPFRLRGQDARVEWQVGNATGLTISAGNGLRLDVDLARHSGGYGFRPDVSGPVSIEVRNRFGAVSVDLGELTLYELPPFHIDLNYLPRPQIPALQAFSPEPLMATLSGRPLLSVGAAEVPYMPSLSTSELVDCLSPGGQVLAVWPHIDEAVTGASHDVTSLITSEGENFVSTLRRALARD